MKRYTAPVEVDSNGDLVLVFPDELLEVLDWNVGDKLLWSNNSDGTWILTKHEDSSPQ